MRGKTEGKGEEMAMGTLAGTSSQYLSKPVRPTQPGILCRQVQWVDCWRWFRPPL